MSLEASRHEDESGAKSERWLGLAIACILLLATLGEGGGEPRSMLVWHGALVAVGVTAAALPRTWGAAGRELAAGPRLAAAAFLALFALGAARAPYGYAALLETLELVAVAGLVWLAAQAGGRGLAALLPPLQLGASLHGLWALVQGLVLGFPRPAGTFLNPNHLALWLVAVTMLGLGSIRPGDGVYDRLRRLALLLPALAAIALTGSRGALLALTAGVAWLVFRRRERPARPWLLAGATAALVFLVVAGLRQVSRIEQHDPWRYQRLRIWRASAGAFLADPLWGSGPGQFRTAAQNLGFPDGEGPLRFDRTFSQTHSDWLRAPVELGLPASLAALAMLASGAAVIRARRRNGTLPRHADGAIAALIAILAHAAVDNPSEWPAVYLLAAVLAGALLASDREGARAWGRPARSALAAAAALLFVVADLAPFVAWREMSRLPPRPLSATERPALDRARALNPLHPAPWLRLAESVVADAGGFDLERYVLAREAAEHAIRLDPRAALYQRALARVEEQGCRTLFSDLACRERTVEAYEQAAARARHDPFIPIALAAFLLDAGDPAGARRQAERALALEPEAVVPRLLLADALLAAGNAEGTVRARRLVDEARERAATRSNEDEAPYARDLLHPAPRIFEAVERHLVTAEREGGAR